MKEDTSKLVEICTKIQKQEQANIIALSSIRDDIKKELSKATKNTKLISAYSNTEIKQGNILDYRQQRYEQKKSDAPFYNIICQRNIYTE